MHIWRRYNYGCGKVFVFCRLLSNITSPKINCGKLAKLADGSATIEHGGTAVLVTAVSSRKPQDGTFFTPLTVDYRSKAAAVGRIPTTYFRREFGPSEREILVGRMIDRSIRPMFDKNYCCETQVVCNLLAFDGQNDPDVLSINAASAALAVSDIPWNGPVAAARIGYVSNAFVINPTRKQLEDSKLNLVVAGRDAENIVMIEASGECMPLNQFKKGLQMALSEIAKTIAQIRQLQASYGKAKRPYKAPHDSLVESDERYQKAYSLLKTPLEQIFKNHSLDKLARDKEQFALQDSVVAQVSELYKDTPTIAIREAVSRMVRQIYRDLVFSTGIRADGRSLRDLRPINCEVDMYSSLHGSALFQRGQTQVMCTLTFDSLDAAFKSDPVSMLTGGLKQKNFMLHYEFPPYATNEVGRLSAGRREMGHGALAEKALRPVVPTDLPFTVRLVCEALESNGSTSMASVCAGTLALMDAGVQISEPVSGCAIGLITRVDPHTQRIADHRVLTDILGMEDYLGDMDFKVATTATGITAAQADIKIDGLPYGMAVEALERSLEANQQILAIMRKTIAKTRPKMKACGPQMTKFQIPAHRRARFMGFGGMHVKRLESELGVSITQVDDCEYQMFAPDPSSMALAQRRIEQLLVDQREPELEFGAIYTAKIIEIKPTGVMVQLHQALPPAFVPNGQLDLKMIRHPSALNMAVGQEIQLKYFGRDPHSGALRLSRKVLMAPPTTIMKDWMKSDNTAAPVATTASTKSDQDGESEHSENTNVNKQT